MSPFAIKQQRKQFVEDREQRIKDEILRNYKIEPFSQSVSLDKTVEETSHASFNQNHDHRDSANHPIPANIYSSLASSPINDLKPSQL